MSAYLCSLSTCTTNQLFTFALILFFFAFADPQHGPASFHQALPSQLCPDHQLATLLLLVLLLCCSAPAAARRQRPHRSANNTRNPNSELNSPANPNSKSYHSLYNGPGNGNGNAGGNGLDGNPGVQITR
jgi:hypothetical protein